MKSKQGANGRRRPARYLNTDGEARAKARVAEAKDKLTKANNDRATVQEKLNDCIDKYNNWMAIFPHQTMRHAKYIQQSGIDFSKQLKDKSGDLYKISKILDCSNTLFYPFWLKENHHEVHNIKVRAQELLPYYGFPEFDNEFIDGFWKEIPHMVQRATNMIFYWDGIDNSTSFKTRLEKKKEDGLPS